jgi:hypothetical protein
MSHVAEELDLANNQLSEQEEGGLVSYMREHRPGCKINGSYLWHPPGLFVARCAR